MPLYIFRPRTCLTRFALAPAPLRSGVIHSFMPHRVTKSLLCAGTRAGCWAEKQEPHSWSSWERQLATLRTVGQYWGRGWCKTDGHQGNHRNRAKGWGGATEPWALSISDSCLHVGNRWGSRHIATNDLHKVTLCEVSHRGGRGRRAGGGPPGGVSPGGVRDCVNQLGRELTDGDV